MNNFVQQNSKTLSVLGRYHYPLIKIEALKTDKFKKQVMEMNKEARQMLGDKAFFYASTFNFPDEVGMVMFTDDAEIFKYESINDIKGAKITKSLTFSSTPLYNDIVEFFGLDSSITNYLMLVKQENVIRAYVYKEPALNKGMEEFISKKIEDFAHVFEETVAETNNFGEKVGAPVVVSVDNE